MGEKRRIGLQFSLDNPRHRQALAYIDKASTGHYTDAVVTAICGYLDREKLCREVQTTIREELKNITITKTTEFEDIFLDDSVVSFLQSR